MELQPDIVDGATAVGGPFIARRKHHEETPAASGSSGTSSTKSGVPHREHAHSGAYIRLLEQRLNEKDDVIESMREILELRAVRDLEDDTWFYNTKQELESALNSAQSHLNQLLHLSCLISSSHNIPTYYATTATHLRQAKLCPWPRSFTGLLPRRKKFVIHDIMMAYVAQYVVNVSNAESYGFNPTSPLSSFSDGWQMKGKPFLDQPPPKGLPSLEGCYTTEILNFITFQANILKFTIGYIYNSCRSIEGEMKREKLLEGFEEGEKGVGKAVRDWAPQVEIMEHRSKVPIAAWPMHSDQPKNAFPVTKTLKVGMVVNTWELREEIVTSSTIAKVVKKLITSKEREEIKKRAEELGASTRQAVEEGGVSRKELDSFIAHITK
ncbi:hypothetical protein RHSIM_Rhsim09G0032700 [Rhododendron simsii]|uniref:Glycosyltransferase N-terminal domain-containing protein n=1 Tax=Rhododendron simsii TaxID=118357 RepID=A0A834GD62_RHOSS|nr:hypothetical protein RHSIM_Rhsim09G0032700 [Rhododendron simsii]